MTIHSMTNNGGTRQFFPQAAMCAFMAGLLSKVRGFRMGMHACRQVLAGARVPVGHVRGAEQRAQRRGRAQAGCCSRRGTRS